MMNVPTEIWLHISQFVPDYELCHLISVNRVFFEVGMDLRWREVSIVTRNTSESMHILKRLSDPFIARKLKSLSIRLTHVKERHRQDSGSNGKDFKRLRQQFQFTVNRVFRILRRENAAAPDNIPSSSSRRTPSPRHPTFTDIIDALIKTTPEFRNIRKLTIDSWDLPPTYHLQHLFESFWAAFGSNLKTLSLGGNLEGYQKFVESGPSLPQLHDLSVEFTNNLFKSSQEEDAVILVNEVAPFINRLNPNLRSLKIWSWADLDLSLFFKTIQIPPNLDSLNTRMAFNTALRDPSGLSDLINGCSSTLTKLDLRLNPTGARNLEREGPLSEWLLECFNSKENHNLNHLQSLSIFPTNTEHGLNILLACLRRTSNTLKEMNIRDKYLKFEELSQLVDVASSCEQLDRLRLNINKLDSAVLDLLASKLSRTKALSIFVADSLIVELRSGTSTSVGIRGIEERSYTNWGLKDLGIWQGGQELDTDTMAVIARSIPSVVNFFGKGHMNHVPNYYY